MLRLGPHAPGMRTDAVVQTAARHQGVLTWGALVERHPRRAVQATIDAGLLVRVGWGAFALPTSPDPLRQAVAHRGVVSHESAARLWFLETLHEPSRTHVTLRRRAHGRPPQGTVLHWTDLDDSEVRGNVTSPLRTVVDCARTMPFPDALAVADSALRRAAVEPDELVRAAVAARGPGVVAARRVAALADARSANPFESGLRAAVIERGLTGFVPQARFRTPRLGGRVDLGDTRRRIALEADSFAHHGGPDALDRDCRRYDELVRTGWLVLRFSWQQVMFDPVWVADCVEDLVALRDVEQRARNRRR